MARCLALLESWNSTSYPSIRSALHCHPCLEGLSDEEEEIEDELYPVEYLLKGSVDFDEPLVFHSLVKQLKWIGMDPWFEVISSDKRRAVVALSVDYPHFGSTDLSSSIFRSDDSMPEGLLPLLFKARDYHQDDGIILYRTTGIAKVAAGYSFLWQVVGDVLSARRTSQAPTVSGDGKVARPSVVSDVSGSDTDSDATTALLLSSETSSSSAASSDGSGDKSGSAPPMEVDNAIDIESHADSAPIEIDTPDGEATCVVTGCDRPRGSCSCICSHHQAEAEMNELPFRHRRPRGGRDPKPGQEPVPNPLPTPNLKAKPKPDLINQRDFDASSSGDTQSSDDSVPLPADDGNSSSVGPINKVRSPIVSFAVLLFSSTIFSHLCFCLPSFNSCHM